MPMYEYRCEGCGTTFERLRKFSDPPVEVHDGCGGKVERLITAAGLRFKGSGWYITDYARAGQKDDGSGEAKKRDDGSGEAKKKDDGSGEVKKKDDSSGEAKKKSDTPAKTESSPAPAAPAKKD